MFLLQRAIRRVRNPEVSSQRDLAAFVTATTFISLTVALSADVAEELIFFAGWPTALRSWAITFTLVMCIAIPISLSIGRTHLRLWKAKQLVNQQLDALKLAHDATEKAHKLADSLARHDVLTGLPNRRVFTEMLEKAVAGVNRGHKRCAILTIDLDRFKPVNDVHGHATGDSVLCEVATRLSEVVRKSDTVARFGGDEFGIIVDFAPSEDPSEVVINLCNRIVERIRETIVVSDKHINVGASVGIALCPTDGAEPETLLRAADMAMYRAKQGGRGRYCFFQQDMETELLAKAALEEDVRQAIASEAIQPHFQPLVKLAANSLSGFEVLARWHHPTRGEVEPETFIPVAEKLGLIGQLTYSLLRRACLDARDWPKEITVAINLSPIHIRDPLLPVKFLSILSETGFPPTRLEVEITESALIDDLPTARAALQALQDIGIKISLDDFGTGYSNLRHLHELQFDKIKIDRSFITSMGTNSDQAKIVHSVLELAKSLGMPTIAEGIEHSQTVKDLMLEGAEFGQGFFFGKAMPAEEADKFVKDSMQRVAPGSAA